MDFKSAAKSFGSAALTTVTVIANAPTNLRIAEIDDEIAKLQQEKAELEGRIVAR